MAEMAPDSSWADEHRELLLLAAAVRATADRQDDPRAFIRNMLADTQKVIPTECSLVLMKNNATGELEVIETCRPGNGENRASAPLTEENLARWAYQIREPVVLNNKILDVTIEPDYSPDIAPSTNSFMFVPLLFAGESLGVLGLINKSIGTFNLRDRYLAETIAHLIVINNQLSARPTETLALKIEEMRILRAMTSGFIGLDTEGKIFLLNDRAREIFELPAGATGKYFYEILPLKATLYRRITAALTEGKTEQRSFSTVELSGQKKIGYSTFILTDDDEQPGGLGIIFQDITRNQQ